MRKVVSSIPDRGNNYSRMSFSSDQVTGTVFPHLKMPFLPNSLSSWGSSNYRPSAPLYEVASHVKQLPFRPLLLLLTTSYRTVHRCIDVIQFARIAIPAILQHSCGFLFECCTNRKYQCRMSCHPQQMSHKLKLSSSSPLKSINITCHVICNKYR